MEKMFSSIEEKLLSGRFHAGTKETAEIVKLLSTKNFFPRDGIANFFIGKLIGYSHSFVDFLEVFLKDEDKVNYYYPTANTEYFFKKIVSPSKILSSSESANEKIQKIHHLIIRDEYLGNVRDILIFLFDEYSSSDGGLKSQIRYLSSYIVEIIINSFRKYVHYSDELRIIRKDIFSLLQSHHLLKEFDGVTLQLKNTPGWRKWIYCLNQKIELSCEDAEYLLEKNSESELHSDDVIHLSKMINLIKNKELTEKFLLKFIHLSKSLVSVCVDQFPEFFYDKKMLEKFLPLNIFLVKIRWSSILNEHHFHIAILFSPEDFPELMNARYSNSEKEIHFIFNEFKSFREKCFLLKKEKYFSFALRNIPEWKKILAEKRRKEKLIISSIIERANPKIEKYLKFIQTLDEDEKNIRSFLMECVEKEKKKERVGYQYFTHILKML